MFKLNDRSLLQFKYRDLVAIALVVLAEVAGILAGGFYWQSFLGGAVGGLMCMGGVLGILFMIDVVLTGRRFRRFINSDRGRFLLQQSRKLPD